MIFLRFSIQFGKIPTESRNIFLNINFNNYIHQLTHSTDHSHSIVFIYVGFVRMPVNTQNLVKQSKFQMKAMFATVSLAEWINDDTCLVEL